MPTTSTLIQFDSKDELKKIMEGVKKLLQTPSALWTADQRIEARRSLESYIAIGECAIRRLNTLEREYVDADIDNVRFPTFGGEYAKRA